ncbi:MAG: RNA polymerase sigma factor [Anaerolineae bacterium]
MLEQAIQQEMTTYLQAEQERIYRLAYSYTQDEQDALDVVQTAMVKALSARDLREPRYLKTWVYRIVVNTAVDLLRQRKRLVLSDDMTSLEGQSPPPDGERWDVHEALEKLPSDLKALVVLRYFQELSLQEVADVLGMNLNTVKTKLYRALRLLRVEVEDDHA